MNSYAGGGGEAKGYEASYTLFFWKKRAFSAYTFVWNVEEREAGRLSERNEPEREERPQPGGWNLNGKNKPKREELRRGRQWTSYYKILFQKLALISISMLWSKERGWRLAVSDVQSTVNTLASMSHTADSFMFGFEQCEHAPRLSTFPWVHWKKN